METRTTMINKEFVLSIYPDAHIERWIYSYAIVVGYSYWGYGNNCSAKTAWKEAANSIRHMMLRKLESQ